MKLIFDKNKVYRLTILRQKGGGNFEELFFKKAYKVELYGNEPNELITFIDFYNQQQIFPFRDPATNRPLVIQVNEVFE